MKNAYSVGQVNRYVKNMFTQDYFLRKINVRGEVSNCKYHPSGHIYFSLKDETGLLRCIMFAGDRRGLAFSMKDGDKVIVGGSLDVYEKDGSYRLYAKEITLEGAGILYERFLALKQELEDMGLFAQEYKQPIPRYIKRLGVVTAPSGAAIQDIRNISLRRNPYLQIILYPALVQGEGAAESIVKGIQMLDSIHVDVIIVGRGGGSIEDLWAFNEEIVARAIFECSTPVISAVGHETDFTIADFAADLRAPTPSAAAELAVDDYRSVVESFSYYRDRFYRAMSGKTDYFSSVLRNYQTKFSYLSPLNRLREQKQQAADYEDTICQAMREKIQENRHRLSVYLERFTGLSPLRKLNQGFGYVENAQRKTVTSVKQVKTGDTIYVSLTDGTIETEVRSIKTEERTDGQPEQS
ncbi:MAG: exodeoxyribonuclease VII large subunit [Clostridia bacterium]|nr:exodeoxyribonuclease VII large subunit [Clostridia bacterium]MDY5555195.1 exodeoxyribonuclease VII large subunit [Blautia sp.]